MSGLAVSLLLPVCPCTRGTACMPAFESCSKTRAATCAKEHKLGQSPLVSAQMRGKNPGRPPGSSSLLFMVLIPGMQYPPKQLLPEARAGNVRVIFATSACGAPPQGTTTLNAGCPLLSLDDWGAPALSAGSGQQESGFIWPDATSGSPQEKEIPSCSRGSLKSSLFLEMVQDELNLDMIAGIWPEVSSLTQEIVCLSLSKHFWLSA